MRISICPYYYADVKQSMTIINNEEQQIVSGSFMDNLTKIINTTYVTPDADSKTFMNYQILDAAHLFTLASALSEDVLNPKMSIHPAS